MLREPRGTWLELLTDGTPGAVSTFPLASKEAWKGSRVGLLKLSGNAIDPKVAAVFIEEFMAAIKELELMEGGL